MKAVQILPVMMSKKSFKGGGLQSKFYQKMSKIYLLSIFLSFKNLIKNHKVSTPLVSDRFIGVHKKEKK